MVASIGSQCSEKSGKVVIELVFSFFPLSYYQRLIADCTVIVTSISFSSHFVVVTLDVSANLFYSVGRFPHDQHWLPINTTKRNERNNYLHDHSTVSTGSVDGRLLSLFCSMPQETQDSIILSAGKQPSTAMNSVDFDGHGLITGLMHK